MVTRPAALNRSAAQTCAASLSDAPPGRPKTSSSRAWSGNPVGPHHSRHAGRGAQGHGFATLRVPTA